jgi:VIT1/CCC1 family predicted Fe2+/Mn2+ transporter
MTQASIFSGIGIAILLVILWLVLGGFRAILEEEAVGQIRRAARALIRRSVRHMSVEHRSIILSRLLAQLKSDELHDRPLSQFVFAFRHWMRSCDFQQLALAVKARIAWVAGMDPQLARLVPSEMSRGVACGLAVVSSGVATATAITLVLHDWLFFSGGVAIAWGAILGLILIAMTRLYLSLGYEESPRSKIGRMILLYPLHALWAWMVTTAFRLCLYRPEILASARGGRSSHDVDLWSGLAVLHNLRDEASAARVEGFLFTMVLLLLSLPLLGLLRPTPLAISTGRHEV